MLRRSPYALLLISSGLACGGSSEMTPQPDPVEITHVSLPPGEVGQTYDLQLEVRGESGFTWTISDGALPTSFTLEETGRLIGNPSTPSMTSFRIRAASGDRIGERDFQLRIAQRISISTTSLPNARERVAYSTQIEAAGGIGIYNWRFVGAPGWLALAAEEHVATISSAAPVRGAHLIDIEVSDGIAIARSELILRVDR